MGFVLKSAFWLGIVLTAINWPQDVKVASDMHASAAPAAERARHAVANKIEKTCLTALADCIDGAARLNKFAGNLADQTIVPTTSFREAPKTIDTLLAEDLALSRETASGPSATSFPASPPLPVARPKSIGR